MTGQSFTAEAAKAAKEKNSSTTKVARDAEEKKNFTADDAKDAMDYKLTLKKVISEEESRQLAILYATRGATLVTLGFVLIILT